MDQSYVALLGGHVAERASRAAALVRGILLLGHSLGLRTVAEGVATRAQLRLVRKLGCQLGQGRLFEGPLDAEALESRLGGRLGPTRWRPRSRPPEPLADGPGRDLGPR